MLTCQIDQTRGENIVIGIWHYDLVIVYFVMLHLYHHEDGGGAEVEGIQPIDQVELESHADQGEEEAKVEETHEPGDGIQNETPANNRD